MKKYLMIPSLLCIMVIVIVLAWVIDGTYPGL
ncbi:UNVERIFIED_ORG: hypothetical protein J2W64_003856 [Rahnella aquatilis]|jgi:hypothetical protein|nr:hypothetical protein [Rahnella aquatilis]